MSVQATLLKIELEVIQIIAIEINAIINHKNVIKLNHTKIIITMNLVKTPEREITTMKTYQDTIFNHHIGVIDKAQINKFKITDVVQENTEGKIIKYNQQTNQFQTLQVVTTNTETSELKDTVKAQTTELTQKTHSIKNA